MPDSTYSPDEARAALASVGEARSKLADMSCPPWRHAAFGAVLGILVAGVGLSPALQAASVAIAMAGVVWLMNWDRKRYGVFVNGYRKGATRPFTFGLVAVLLALIVAQIYLRDAGASSAAHLAVGGVAFLVGTAASVIWTRIFRREMGAGR